MCFHLRENLRPDKASKEFKILQSNKNISLLMYTHFLLTDQKRKNAFPVQ